LTRAVSDLGEILADQVSRQRTEMISALKNVQRYGTADYADLVDVTKILSHIKQNPAILRVANRVETATRAVVAFHGTMGVRLEGSHGISIYLPRRRSVWMTYRPSYKELEFAKDFEGWARFLDRFFATEE
jgi:hypothetical protein